MSVCVCTNVHMHVCICVCVCVCVYRLLQCLPDPMHPLPVVVTAITAQSPVLEGSEAGFSVGKTGHKVRRTHPTTSPASQQKKRTIGSTETKNAGVEPHELMHKCGCVGVQVIVEQLAREEKFQGTLSSAQAILAAPAEVPGAWTTKTRTRRAVDRTVR